MRRLMDVIRSMARYPRLLPWLHVSKPRHAVAVETMLNAKGTIRYARRELERYKRELELYRGGPLDDPRYGQRK